MNMPFPRRALGIASFAIAGVVLLAGSASSEPLTQTVHIEVPVRLADIHPDIKSLSVQCQLGPYFLREDVNFQRNYSGVVRLTSQPIANEVAGTIKDWRCRLFLFPAGGQGAQPSFEAQDEKYRAKAGTKLMVEVKGSLGPAIPLRVVPGLQRPNIAR